MSDNSSGCGDQAFICARLPAKGAKVWWEPFYLAEGVESAKRVMAVMNAKHGEFAVELGVEAAAGMSEAERVNAERKVEAVAEEVEAYHASMDFDYFDLGEPRPAESYDYPSEGGPSLASLHDEAAKIAERLVKADGERDRPKVDAAVRAGRQRAEAAYRDRFASPPTLDGRDRTDRLVDEDIERQERIHDLHSPADASVEALILRRMEAVKVAGADWLEHGDRYLEGLREAMVPLVMTVEAADSDMDVRLGPRVEAVRKADAAYRSAVRWELEVQHTPEDAAWRVRGGGWSPSDAIDSAVWSRFVEEVLSLHAEFESYPKAFIEWRGEALHAAGRERSEGHRVLAETVARLLTLLGVERYRLGGIPSLAGASSDGAISDGTDISAEDDERRRKVATVERGLNLPTAAALTPEMLATLEVVYRWGYEPYPFEAGGATVHPEIPLPWMMLRASLLAIGMQRFEVEVATRLLIKLGLIEQTQVEPHRTCSWVMPSGVRVSLRGSTATSDGQQECVHTVGLDGVQALQVRHEAGPRPAFVITAEGVGVWMSSRVASPAAEQSTEGAVGVGKSREQVKIEAERIVKRDGYDGFNKLHRAVRCGKGNLQAAIEESPYLKARKAEHEEKQNKGKAVPMTDAVMDATPSTRELSTEEQDRLIDELHDESLAEERRDERQHRRAKKRSA